MQSQLIDDGSFLHLRCDVDEDTLTLSVRQEDALCVLLQVPRYHKDWPKIPLSELEASAVRHPGRPGVLLLLHKRRIPYRKLEGTDIKQADLESKWPVCTDCWSALTANRPYMPKFALANSNWIGRVPPWLRNGPDCNRDGLTEGTKRLLAAARICAQTIILGEEKTEFRPGYRKWRSRDEHQKGLVGNMICLPQANQALLQETIPARPGTGALTATTNIAFVGRSTADLSRAKWLNVPQAEFRRGADGLLQHNQAFARFVQVDPQAVIELGGPEEAAPVLLECVTHVPEGRVDALPKQGPADAVEGEGPQGFSHAEVTKRTSEETQSCEDDEAPNGGEGGSDDEWEAAEGLRYVGSIPVGAAGSVTDQFLALQRNVEDLSDQCKQLRADAAKNDVSTKEGKRHEFADEEQMTAVRRQVLSLQSAVTGMNRQQLEKKLEQEVTAMRQRSATTPAQVAVPLTGRPFSMYDPDLYALAKPYLFPYGDGVPFLPRSTPLTFLECSQLHLRREELSYDEIDQIPGVAVVMVEWNDPHLIDGVGQPLPDTGENPDCVRIDIIRPTSSATLLRG